MRSLYMKGVAVCGLSLAAFLLSASGAGAQDLTKLQTVMEEANQLHAKAVSDLQPARKARDEADAEVDTKRADLRAKGADRSAACQGKPKTDEGCIEAQAAEDAARAALTTARATRDQAVADFRTANTAVEDASAAYTASRNAYFTAVAEAISVTEAARDAALEELQTAGENLRQAAADYDALQEESDQLQVLVDDVVLGCLPYEDADAVGGYETDNGSTQLCVPTWVVYSGECYLERDTLAMDRRVTIRSSGANFTVYSPASQLLIKEHFNVKPLENLKKIGLNGGEYKGIFEYISQGQSLRFRVPGNASSSFNSATGLVDEGVGSYLETELAKVLSNIRTVIAGDFDTLTPPTACQ